MFKKIIFSLAILLQLSYQTHAQHDADTLLNVMLKYKLNENFLPDSISSDTSINAFHIFKLPEKQSISVSTLGNLGSAYQSNVFFDRDDTYFNDYIFSNPYYLYTFSARNNLYFNTRKPYTEVFHSMSSKAKDEQTLRFIHTQNVNPFFNIGADYQMFTSLGEYQNQQVRMNSVTFHANYEKKRYQLHAALVYNNFKYQENGGVVDTSTVDINLISSYLEGANSKIIHRDIFASQKYLFGKMQTFNYKDTIVKRINAKFSIGHSFQQGVRHRTYEDAEAAQNGYYENFYLIPTSSYDSTAYRFIENRISVNSERVFTQKTGLKFTAGVGNIQKRYFNFKEYLYSNYLSYYSDNLIFATIKKSVFEYSELKFNGEQYVSGYRAGDYRFSVNLSKFGADSSLFAFDLNVKAERKNPDFFTTNFYSNHYEWETDFIPSERLQAELSAGIPKYSFEVKASGAQLINYIYFGIDANPKQYDDNLTVMSVSLRKDFHFKHLHLYNTAIWQQSGNDSVLSLPELVFYHGLAVQMYYKTHLSLQLGYEISYSTAYKMSGFNPAIGQFYNDYSANAGNYPIANAFVNARIKRNVQLFFKFEHLNSGITQLLYTPVTHYPIKSRIWKIGVKWTFKN